MPEYNGGNNMRNLLWAMIFSAMAVPAWAGEMINTPVLSSVDNFRDVAGVATEYGGTGQAYAASGGPLRVGQVYRANALTLSPADMATVKKLGITEVIDLRTPSETKKHPDTVPPGVGYMDVNIYGTQAVSFIPASNSAEAQAEMEGYYRGFVSNTVQRQGFRNAVLAVAHAKGPVLFHCSAGKDRSGWLAAILQSIAGVSQADIMSGYLASNEYTAASAKAMLAKMPPSQRAIYESALKLQPLYLNTGFNTATQEYGSMDGYITKGLGLTPDELAAVRRKLVGR
jgi:protein-tyrosine phosphatase